MMGPAARTRPNPLQGRLLLAYGRFASCGLLGLGLLGFLRTGFDHFSNVTGHSLLIFTVNPETNLIHLIAGLVGIAMTASSPFLARRYALLIGGLGLPWAIAGYLLDGSLSDFFARNAALNTTHLAISIVALALALWPSWPAPREMSALAP